MTKKDARTPRAYRKLLSFIKKAPFRHLVTAALVSNRPDEF